MRSEKTSLKIKSKRSESNREIPHDGFQHEIKLLCGVVCGSSDTGKSSLLQRLRGEKSILNKKNRRKMMALIPWMCDIKDNRYLLGYESSTRTIQLHIVEQQNYSIDKNGNDIPENGGYNGVIDFVIIMIDRRREETLEEGVNLMKVMISQGSKCSKQLSFSSICVVLNFYDSIKPKIVDEVNPPLEEHNSLDVDCDINGLISIDQVETRFQRELKQLNIQSDSLKICCIEGCMINGYGLQALNSFIELPWLKRREREIVREMETIENGLQNWDEHFSAQNFITYEELRLNTPSTDPTGPPSGKISENKGINTDLNKKISKSNILDPKLSLVKAQEDQVDLEPRKIIQNINAPIKVGEDKSKIKSLTCERGLHQDNLNMENNRRKTEDKMLFDRAQKVSFLKSQDPKQALEMFLEFDDDDSDDKNEKYSCNRITNLAGNSKKKSPSSKITALLNSDSDSDSS